MNKTANKTFQNVLDGMAYGRSIESELNDPERKECATIQKYCLQTMRELREIVRDAADVMLKCPELRCNVSRLARGGFSCSIGASRIDFDCKDLHIADCSFTVYHKRDNIWAGAANDNLDFTVYNFDSIDQEITFLECAKMSFEKWVGKKAMVEKSRKAGFTIVEAVRSAESRYMNLVMERYEACEKSAEHAKKNLQ